MSNSTATFDPIVQSQASKEVTANAYFDAASPATLYGRRQSTCTGLVFGYYGGNVTKSDGALVQIANSTLNLTASNTNYIVAKKEDGVVSASTATTNWNNLTDYWRLYSVVTSASSVTSYTDSREIGRMTGGDKTSSTGSAPVTKTGNFTVASGEEQIIVNGTGTVTATLPAAASFSGRKLRIKTVAAFAVSSAASNVVPLAGGAASTGIVSATAGKWAELVSDGSNWIIMAGN